MQSLVQQKVVRVQTNMRLQGMKAVGEVLKLEEERFLFSSTVSLPMITLFLQVRSCNVM